MVSFECIQDLIKNIDSEKFSPDIFLKTGLFIIRNGINLDTIKIWQNEWKVFYNNNKLIDRNIIGNNPVSIDLNPGGVLGAAYKCPDILAVIMKAFGENIALYNQRFVVKDKKSSEPVFLHSDYPYHLGWPFKASAFVPLSLVNKENGGMYFYPGTHQFGYLADAGEIDLGSFPSNLPSVCPTLYPGDFILMNSLTWHGSGPNIAGVDRVLIDIIYQPANDPSSKELVCGEWETDIFFTCEKEKVYKRSRTTKIKELLKKLANLEGSLN